MSGWVLVAASFIIATVGTELFRRQALARSLLDTPNQRSSHKTPVPRGGGIAIVFTTTLAFIVLYMMDILDSDLLLVLIGGGATVALVGFIDDHRHLSVHVRLALHFAAAFWALFCFMGLPSLQIADGFVSFGWFGYFLGALGIVWTLNLFNFMDGIDGIAASEAIFITLAGAVLESIHGPSSAVPVAGVVIGAGCLGFLVWNWPPAKIFMGDIGSGYLGYSIAVLAIGAARENPVAPLVWLILGGVFFVDATVTLLHRLIRRERVYEAHRTHAYQWLALRWGSHKRVTVSVMIVNMIWLLPLAWLATDRPGEAVWIVLIAFAPLIVLAVVMGAGRNDVYRSSTSDH